MEYPSIISIALTTRCNANCIMCWRRHIPGYSQDMSQLTYSHLLQSLEVLPSHTTIFLSTGEPTISSYLENFLNFCLKKEFKVLIYSNAQQMPVGIEHFIQNGGHISFGLSIDGGTEEIVNKIQRGCSLKKMLSFITSIRQISYQSDNPVIDVNFIANAENIVSVIQLANLLIPNSVDNFQISPMKYFPIINNKELEDSINKYLCTDWSALFQELEMLLARKNTKLKVYSPKGKNYYFPSRCLRRKSMAVISVLGDVYPCCGTESVILGNINDSPLLTLWNSQLRKDIMEGLRNNHLHECCSKCSFTASNNAEYYTPHLNNSTPI